MLASLSSTVHGNGDLSVFLLLAAAAVFVIAGIMYLIRRSPRPHKDPPAETAVCVGLCLVAIGLAVA